MAFWSEALTVPAVLFATDTLSDHVDGRRLPRLNYQRWVSLLAGAVDVATHGNCGEAACAASVSHYTPETAGRAGNDPALGKFPPRCCRGARYGAVDRRSPSGFYVGDGDDVVFYHMMRALGFTRTSSVTRGNPNVKCKIYYVRNTH